MNLDFERLRQIVIGQFHCPGNSVHGPDHWQRVERNGLLLASRTGADPILVRLFALFHDSRRLNDYDDEGHGARGADFAAELRGMMGGINDADFERLQYACRWHTEGQHHLDPTIATCWDADRLDLGRVGTIPSSEFMSTAFGREIAESGSIRPFLPSDGRIE